MRSIMARIRGLLYRRGYRPRRGSIFHSPSLHMRCWVEETSESLGVRVVPYYDYDDDGYDYDDDDDY